MLLRRATATGVRAVRSANVARVTGASQGCDGPGRAQPLALALAVGAIGAAGFWGSDLTACEGIEKQYKYVVIGAGLSGFSAVEELSQRDPQGSVLLVGKENEMPYSRPPLSKELFQSSNPDVGATLTFNGEGGEPVNVYFQNEESFAKAHPKVTYAKGVQCTGLDTENKSVTLNSGETVNFDKCLLATGAQPKQWPYQEAEIHQKLIDNGDVMYFRTVDDFKRIEKASQNQEDIVVVGGGFLGTELANALNLRAKAAKLNKTPRVGQKQRQVTHVIPEPGVLYRFLPRYLSDFAANKMASHGVDVRTNTLVTGITQQPNGKLLVTLTVRTFGNMRTGPGSSQVGWQDIRKYTIKCNKVVFAVGVVPSVKLAKDAGLEIDKTVGGIVANRRLQVAHLEEGYDDSIYAAGDVVSYYDSTLGRRRLEHYDHARSTGQLAARNMVLQANGKKAENYTDMSSYWSDLLDLGIHFDMIGDVKNGLRTVGFWEIDRKVYYGNDERVPDHETKEYTKGIVYYLDEEEKVVGVCLWNIDEDGVIDQARAIIEKGTVVEDMLELRGAIKVQDAKLREIMTT